MDALAKELKKYGKTKANIALRKHTAIKIGGPGAYFVSVENTDKLCALISYLSGEGIDYFILGGGSNVLFPDDGFQGVVVKIDTAGLKVAGNEIMAEAGVALSAVVNLAAENTLTGMEWATGIPGTIGGAVRGNAGAMGKDMSQSISEVVFWRDGETFTASGDDCGFGYRTSMFKQDGGVVLKVKFKLAKGDKKEILNQMQNLISHRHGKFPSYPSAGSFFKNIKIADWPNGREILPAIYLERGTVPAGWLIEQCGLKEYRIGDAGISREHGNFIVNFGKATAEDVLRVVEKVKKEVYNKFKVELEPEVQIIKQ